LEPDYEGLKRFDPVMKKFRDTFYDGNKEDPECAEKPKPVRGGKGRAKPNTVVHDFSASHS
jgi:hypothetical protein